MSFFKKKTATGETQDQVQTALEAAQGIKDLFQSNLQSLMSDIDQNKNLASLIEDTTKYLQSAEKMIDDAAKDNAVIKDQIAEKFATLSNVFTSISEKVQQANIPTTADVAAVTKEAITKAFLPKK
jgi:uncharacterized phage infection (PIP) family protein YhgE